MKKGIAALLALAFIAFLGYACDTGGIVTERVNVSGASAAKLYYPSYISSPVGATTMSSGFTQTLQNIEWLSKRVAGEGYVVLGMTPTNIMGMVGGWTNMHKNGIRKLQQLNSSHNKLRGMIDTNKLQISGHSKGGGGSLAAGAQLGGEVASVVAHAPYCGGEYSQASLRNMQADTFIQAGASDTLATNIMTRGEYDSLSNSISKMYKEYTGFGHLAWTTGAGMNHQRLIGDNTVAWMKYYLDGDTSRASILQSKAGTSRYKWQQ